LLVDRPQTSFMISSGVNQVCGHAIIILTCSITFCISVYQKGLLVCAYRRSNKQILLFAVVLASL